MAFVIKTLGLPRHPGSQREAKPLRVSWLRDDIRSSAVAEALGIILWLLPVTSYYQ